MDQEHHSLSLQPRVESECGSADGEDRKEVQIIIQCEWSEEEVLRKVEPRDRSHLEDRKHLIIKRVKLNDNMFKYLV